MNKATISVIVPTYNTPFHWLKEAISSVLKQTFENFELIIIDDFGEVPFSGLDKELNDHRVRWIRNETNMGVSETRNLGVKKAKGEWVAFLDADDWWSPEKLELQLAAAARDNAQWVYASAFLVDKQGEVRMSSIAKQRDNLFQDLLKHNVVTGSCSGVLMLKSLFERAGGFDTENDLIEDWDLWLKVAKIGRATCVEEPIVFLRTFHAMNRSADLKKYLRLKRLQEKYAEELKNAGLVRYAHAHYYYVVARQNFLSKKFLLAFYYLMGAFFSSPTYLLNKGLGSFLLKSIRYIRAK